MKTRSPLGWRDMLVVLGVAAAAALAACDHDPSTATPLASADAATVGASAAPAVRPEPYAQEQLPDEADYAAEAEREITGDNYVDKLAEIERQLAPPADGGVLAADAGDVGVPDARTVDGAAPGTAGRAAADGGSTRRGPGRSERPAP